MKSMHKEFCVNNLPAYYAFCPRNYFQGNSRYAASTRNI